MKKILCVVQARMGSERLPGKVIKPILNKPMILHTLDRLSKSNYINELILATSELEKEELLVQIVKEAKYNVFRGSENNVLDRYKKASDLYKGDIIIRVTGDCPLIDPVIVDNVISNFIMNDYDYVRLDVPDTFIRGFDVEVFSKEALDKTFKSVKEDKHREHVTLYMYENRDKFKVGYVKGEELYNKNYRLCVDTKEDLELVTNIYEHFKDEFVSSKEIVKYLNDNPKLAQINLEVVQKNV
jgi:Spore coat polysaccharide biosynthesis protein F, CMP-KDO synthetase homolog